MTEKTPDKISVLRETDDEARRLARTLVRGARFMALAVIDPDTGFPSASRALTATDVDGTPVILISALSAHTKGLLADPRCSLLAGEPRKGDPLAYARISLQCLAEPVERPGEDHDDIRERFLHRHQKASLYVDFPDFRFFRLVPQSASLNGGFGKAYALPGSDLLVAGPVPRAIWRDLQREFRKMSDLAAKIGLRLSSNKHDDWRFAGIDPSGFDLIDGNSQIRHEFPRPFFSSREAYDYIETLANSDESKHSLPQN